MEIIILVCALLSWTLLLYTTTADMHPAVSKRHASGRAHGIQERE